MTSPPSYDVFEMIARTDTNSIAFDDTEAFGEVVCDDERGFVGLSVIVGLVVVGDVFSIWKELEEVGRKEGE